LFTYSQLIGAPFLVALGHVAGHDLEAVLPGEIEVAGIELGRLAADMRQHPRAQIVDHPLAGHSQGVEGVDVRGQEVLHGLGQGELHIQPPAVGQDHDEKGQAAAGLAHGDGPPFAPLCRHPDYAESQHWGCLFAHRIRHKSVHGSE
jgi:hypothetical protein